MTLLRSFETLVLGARSKADAIPKLLKELQEAYLPGLKDSLQDEAKRKAEEFEAVKGSEIFVSPSDGPSFQKKARRPSDTETGFKGVVRRR